MIGNGERVIVVVDGEKSQGTVVSSVENENGLVYVVKLSDGSQVVLKEMDVKKEI